MAYETGSPAATGIQTTPAVASGATAGGAPWAGSIVAPGADTRRWKTIVYAAERHAIADAKKWDPYRKDFSAGQYRDEEDEVIANFTFAFISMLMAVLYTEAPTIECDPREGSGQADAHFAPAVQMGLVRDMATAKRMYADTLEQVLTHDFQRANSAEQNSAALQDALITGLAWTEESWDPGRMTDRLDFFRRHEIYPDPLARFEVRDCRWICKTCLLDVEAARAFFADKSPTQRIEPNFTLAELTDQRGQLAKDNSPEVSGDKDMFKFYGIWAKSAAGAPNKIVYLPYNKGDVLTETPWPFTLDKDDFPFTPLRFNKSGQQITDAFSEIHVVSGLRKAQQRMLEFTRKWAERAIGKLWIYDQGIAGVTEAIEKAKKGKELVLQGLDLKGGKELKDVFHLIDFAQGDTNELAMDLAKDLKNITDEITGQDELTRGAVTHDMTAEEARIRADFGELRNSARGVRWDAAQTNQVEHRAQIARQLMPPEQVAKIAGPQSALLWELHAADPEDFKAEYTVKIAAGSAGLRGKQDKFQRLGGMLQDAMATNQAVGQPVFDIVQITLDKMRQYTRNPERYETQPGTAGGIAPQQIQAPDATPNGAAGASPAQPAPRGPVRAGPAAAPVAGGARPGQTAPQPVTAIAGAHA